VVHHREDLPLRLEAGDQLGRVQAEADQLQSDPAADGIFLLGGVDDAHAALAEDLLDPVGADPPAQPPLGPPGDSHEAVEEAVSAGKPRSLLAGREKVLDLPAQGVVPRAG
jgi:hypothetical protein